MSGIRALILSMPMLFGLELHCQELRFQHLTVEDGLSDNAITCVHEDRVGFIWIGTVIMFLAGALSLSDRRLRVGAPVRARGLKVVPLCPFTKATLQKHPEWQDILKDPF